MKHMDYKGIKYQLVRTTHPTNLKWTVEVEGKGPIGSCHTRAAATALAQWTIDELVKPNRSDEL
jgi:hypothetical protein